MSIFLGFVAERYIVKIMWCKFRYYHTVSARSCSENYGRTFKQKTIKAMTHAEAWHENFLTEYARHTLDSEVEKLLSCPKNIVWFADFSEFPQNFFYRKFFQILKNGLFREFWKWNTLAWYHSTGFRSQNRLVQLILTWKFFTLLHYILHRGFAMYSW